MSHIRVPSQRRAFWESVIILWFVFFPHYLFPHELTIMGGGTNFTSDKVVTEMPPQINDQVYHVLGNIRLSGDFAENISYSLDLGIDRIWRYYLAGEAVFRFSIFKLGAGSFFHYSENEDEILNPAVMVNFGIELPGFFFLDGKMNSTFSEDSPKIGTIGYNYLGLSAGYWTQDLIAGFYFDTKEIPEKRTDTLLVRDSLTRYFFHAGIYDKNRMWTVYLDLGYEELEFEMTKTNAETARAEALFAGLEVIVQITNGLEWHIKSELPYPFVYPADFFWWTVATGLTIKLAD